MNLLFKISLLIILILGISLSCVCLLNMIGVITNLIFFGQPIIFGILFFGIILMISILPFIKELFND